MRPCAPQLCSPRAALPCSLRAALPCSPRAALPCSPRAALPCSPLAALPCSPHAALPYLALLPTCPAANALPCPAASALPCPHALQPARCPACAALQPTRCPACAALQPARCPALQPARHPALQPARCPARLLVQPCSLHAALPYSACATLPLQRLPLLLLLQLQQSLLTPFSRVTRILYRSSSFVIGLFGEAVLVVEEMVQERGCPGGGGYVPGGTRQQQQQSQPETPSPQQPQEWFSQRLVSRSVGAYALGGSASAATGAIESAASAEALHTFTLDSCASRCFFRDCTTVTPLATPVPVSLADPSGGPVVARVSTVLPYPAVPSGSLSGLHLPSFSTNLVSNAVLQDVWVDKFTPRGQRVAICTCSWTGRHLATFTRQPGSSLYTLTTSSTQVAASGQMAVSSQVSASGQLVVSFSCRVLSHQTLLWHHRLGHPSLPRLCSMHSHLLVSGLPRSLPPLPRSLAPPCLPYIEGWQRAAPHSSSFPPTTAPLQTLHMDVWGPAPVRGTHQERYFLLVVDDYMCYTTFFPLRNKADVRSVLIPWIRATCHQLHEWFQRDLPVLRLHSDRGGEFSFDLLAGLCRDKGIAQSFTLLASPQQNGIAQRRIGLIMEVARTSMIHAAAPHFLWSFAVRYAAHQLNLWPRVSLPETWPTLRWRGVGVSGLGRALPCPRYHREQALSSHSPLRLPGLPHRRPTVAVLPPSLASIPGLAPLGVSQVDPPPLVEPLVISSDTTGPAEGDDPAADVMATTHRSPRLGTPPGFLPRPSSPPLQPVDVGTGAAGGGDTGGEDAGGAGLGGAETGGGETGGGESGGEGSGGASSGVSDFGGADSTGAASPSGGGAVAAPAAGPGVGQQQPPSRLKTPSPQQLREWVVWRGRSGAGAWSFTAP
ncbi:unnamed protein product [Closterium sp. NIES-54]